MMDIKISYYMNIEEKCNDIRKKYEKIFDDEFHNVDGIKP